MGVLKGEHYREALKEHKPLVSWITIDLTKKGLKKAIGGSNTTITKLFLTLQTLQNLLPVISGLQPRLVILPCLHLQQKIHPMVQPHPMLPQRKVVILMEQR